MNKVPIFFCFDKNMVIPAGVCITSMLLNKDTETFYDFSFYIMKKIFH